MIRNRPVLSGGLVLLTLLGIHLASSGQVRHPAPGFVFDDSEVPRIDISINNLDEYITNWL